MRIDSLPMSIGYIYSVNTPYNAIVAMYIYADHDETIAMYINKGTSMHIRY